MSIDTVFYIVGSVTAILAVTLSFVGLKLKGFPSKGALGGLIFFFAVLVIGTGGLAVAVARHEQDQRRAEQAVAEQDTAASEEADSVGADGGGNEQTGEPQILQDDGSDQGESGEGQSGQGQSGQRAPAQGQAETLEVAADETALAYDQTELQASAGEITIDFDNPAAIPHDVVIRGDDGSDIARTDVITESSDSLTTELDAGQFEFYCSVPGHEQAGMVGTLTVE